VKRTLRQSLEDRGPIVTQKTLPLWPGGASEQTSVDELQVNNAHRLLLVIKGLDEHGETRTNKRHLLTWPSVHLIFL